jgi:hypothetical protein
VFPFGIEENPSVTRAVTMATHPQSLGFSGEAKMAPSVARGSISHWKPDGQLHSMAVRRTLSTGGKLKTEIPDQNRTF